MNRYESAKAIFAKAGVDTEKALALLADKPISIHCWQGDDVTGFDNPAGGAGNGIQTTGDYPGRARDFEELKADLRRAFSLIPGKKRLNLHACYAVFPQGEWVDRDRLEYRHFLPWVEFAREEGVGLDFNPTVFSHPMMKDGLSLSSPDEAVRRFWIDHGKACIRISQYLAEELGHFETSSGDILDQSDPLNRKQEQLARLRAYDIMINLDGLIRCYERGCRNLYEMAEYLEVTEEFLKDALQRYREHYGDKTVYKDDLTETDIQDWINSRRSGRDTTAKAASKPVAGKRSFSIKK